MGPFLMKRFVGEWSSAQQPLFIAYKELFPVVVAAYLWGHSGSKNALNFVPTRLYCKPSKDIRCQAQH